MISGEAFCRTVLHELPQRGAPHQVYAVVKDIDNSLTDTRYRTRAAGEAFAKKYPADGAALAKLKINQIYRDGRTTAQKMGLAPLVVEAFHQFWEPFFWNPDNFLLDAPLRRTIRIAQQAKKVPGVRIKNFYLTGRIQDLFAGTMTQLKSLERLGLPKVKESQLICKPTMEHRTEWFKVDELLKLEARGIKPLFFISDSQPEIAAVQLKTSTPCVFVDFPGQIQESFIDVKTPRIRIPRK